jgi:hypothetical protein
MSLICPKRHGENVGDECKICTYGEKRTPGKFSDPGRVKDAA